MHQIKHRNAVLVTTILMPDDKPSRTSYFPRQVTPNASIERSQCMGSKVGSKSLGFGRRSFSFTHAHSPWYGRWRSTGTSAGIVLQFHNFRVVIRRSPCFRHLFFLALQRFHPHRPSCSARVSFFGGLCWFSVLAVRSDRPMASVAVFVWSTTIQSGMSLM
ncbi:hypothetical protein EX30DRAFT_152463 [Ascodesmis nigricans]|uniref:Uncharacterized protein n=1 Tax=Ascodesmis nigricans TaxID=341454 RepID=A0A4S2N2P5_9PEZI|nr:hypothetical protein EX30DRAFT_152463 [Ascodesmis nigricans]